MSYLKFTGHVLAGLLLIAASGTTLKAQSTGTAPERGPKKAPINYSAPTDGGQMYKDYCAACHGMEGRGDGPVAPFLKTPLPDLGKLAQRNGGKFPSTRVMSVLRFGTDSHAHGTADMPIWGSLFQTQHHSGGAAASELRIANLTDFISSLQD